MNGDASVRVQRCDPQVVRVQRGLQKFTGVALGLGGCKATAWRLRGYTAAAPGPGCRAVGVECNTRLLLGCKVGGLGRGGCNAVVWEPWGRKTEALLWG